MRGQYPHLVLPRVAEHVHVVLGHLAPRPARQHSGSVDHLRRWCEIFLDSPKYFLTYLRTEVLYLLRGVADHLDPVLVGGHAAGEVGNLHQLVSVLSKHASRLVNLTIVLLRYFSGE